MLDDQQLEELLVDLESDRVERKESLSDKNRVAQAICAFSNDLPDHRLPGVVFIGAKDDGSCAGLNVDDTLLLTISDMKTNGKIHPFPSMTVQKRRIAGCELVVIEVQPSDSPPVRYDGVTWIRVGPRRDKATAEDERRLTEKRRYRNLPFDIQPVPFAAIEDLDLTRFSQEYISAAVAPEVIAENGRTTPEKLSSLRFTTPDGVPTATGVLILGKDPRQLIPSAYVQFLRIEGTELGGAILDEKEVSGPLAEVFRQLDDIMRVNIKTSIDIVSGSIDIRRPEYPISALQQIVRNAILHRNYDGTNAPVRIYWFDDRIEILNPGGPFGQVTIQNFGRAGITDYRNPNIAEAVKVLGYVQKFGVGIATARRELASNGNPPLEFSLEDTYVLAILRRRV